jgi:hypothetical protein
MGWGFKAVLFVLLEFLVPRVAAFEKTSMRV